MTTEGQSRLAMMNIHYGTAIGREKRRIPTFGDKENVKYCKIPTQSLRVFGKLFSANYITRWKKKSNKNFP